jgi:hypothetical protein
MKFRFGSPAACLALAFVFITAAPASHALLSKSQEKQAHKMQSRLAKYPAGSFLHLTFRDGTQSNGKLGALADTGFSFANADSNTNETHAYSDVTKIQKGKEYIGEGTAPHHHIHVF